jgi:Carboxypeptidase regulatory-like domain
MLSTGIVHPSSRKFNMKRTTALSVLLLCVTFCATKLLCAAQEYGTISGTVTGSNGAAVSHATVTADYVCVVPCVKAMALDQTETDDQGRYQFKRLPYGRYALSAEKAKDDYPPLYLSLYQVEKNPEIELSETSRDVSFDIKLTNKAGVLVGTVADADTGKPLDASVEFRSTTDQRRFLSGSGLTNAHFRVLVPSDTPVLMKVSRTGYDDWFFTQNGAVAPLQLGPGETLKLAIRMKQANSQPTAQR